jgi:hypothetical protein
MPQEPLLDRRQLLSGLALAGLGTAALPDASFAKAAGLSLETPEDNLRALIRLTASLREEDCPWYYDGTIYACVGEEQPRPLLAFTGVEIYRMLRVSPTEYRMIANTITYYRDAVSQQFLYKFPNPYTGVVNEVTPAVQSSGTAPDSGFEYSINGVRPVRFRSQFADRPLQMWWTAVGDYVWLHDSTVYPPGLKAPRMQRKTNFIRRDQFLDPTMDRLPTMFTASVFQPWPAWMQMGDRPGHVVWHASGAKLRSIDEIPDEHRLRALKDHPAFLRLSGS